MRFPDEDPFLPYVKHGCLCLYVAIALFGVVWIDDDFDAVRFGLASVIGVPLFVGWYALGLFFPNWKTERPTVARLWVITLIASFALGHFALLNVAGGESEPKTHHRSYHQTNIASEQFRGAFGILYELRW